MVERLAPYRSVLRARLRSQRSHRVSFATDLVAAALVGFVELVEIWVLFHAVDSIGGFDLARMLLVFGLADMTFSLADLFVGHVDDLPKYLKAGTLDVFFLRPQPVLLQLVTSDLSLRRLARAAVGAGALGVGLWLVPIDWTPAAVGLLVLAVVSGVAMFAALFVTAAGLQFFLLDGSEMTNAFVYGGRYAATQPATIWPRSLIVVFGFVFPIAFAAFLPVTTLLGVPGFGGLTWLGWCAPLAAGWAWLVALGSWRWGIRHYQGGGG